MQNFAILRKIVIPDFRILPAIDMIRNCGGGGPATKRNRLRDLKSLGYIEIYRFLKIYNYDEDLSRFLEVCREL